MEIRPVTTAVRRLKSTYHAYPQPFWVLTTGVFVDRLGTNLIIPFLAIYVAQRFGGQLTQVGVIYTLYAMGGLAGNLLAGALADRFGRRFTLLVGMICAATARVGMGLATDFTGLYVAAAFAGFFGNVDWPAHLAMLADLLGPEKRADGYGIQRVVINLTYALSPLAGGLLAPLTGYLLLFVLDAVTSYFVALVVYSKLPETRPARRRGAPAENFAQTLAGYKRVLQDRTFTIFLLISILTVIVFMQMNTTLSVFLVKFRQMPESFYGALVMLNAVMVVLLQIPITRWVAKRSLLWRMIGGTALYLVGFGSYGLAPSVPLFVIAMALITGGEMLVMPTSQAVTAQLAPEDMRARYAAAERFNWIIAQSVGPVAATAIMDRFDPRWVWYGCSILCAISMGGYYGLRLRSGRRLSANQDEAAGRRDKAAPPPAAAQPVSTEYT